MPVAALPRRTGLRIIGVLRKPAAGIAVGVILGNNPDQSRGIGKIRMKREDREWRMEREMSFDVLNDFTELGYIDGRIVRFVIYVN